MTTDRFAALREYIAGRAHNDDVLLNVQLVRELLDAADERDRLQQDDAYIALKLNNDDLRIRAERAEAQRDRLAAALWAIANGEIKPPLTSEQAQQMMRWQDVARAAIAGMEP